MHWARRVGEGGEKGKARRNASARLSFSGTCRPGPGRLQIRLFARETRDVANYYSNGHSPSSFALSGTVAERAEGVGKRTPPRLSSHLSLTLTSVKTRTQYRVTARDLCLRFIRALNAKIQLLYLYRALVYPALVKKGKKRTIVKGKILYLTLFCVIIQS